MSRDNLETTGDESAVCVADCYFIVNVPDLPFASPIAIISLTLYINQ